MGEKSFYRDFHLLFECVFHKKICSWKHLRFTYAYGFWWLVMYKNVIKRWTLFLFRFINVLWSFYDATSVMNVLMLLNTLRLSFVIGQFSSIFIIFHQVKRFNYLHGQEIKFTWRALTIFLIIFQKAPRRELFKLFENCKFKFLFKFCLSPFNWNLKVFINAILVSTHQKSKFFKAIFLFVSSFS